MGDFCRTLSQQFIEVLNDEYAKGGWWRRVVDNNKLFLAVRGNTLNTYYGGMSIIQVRMSRNAVVGRTHLKFLVDCRKSAYADFDSTCCKSHPSIPMFVDLDKDLDMIINNAKAFVSEEKKGVHKITMSSLNVLDVEICLAGESENRLDIAAIEQADHGHKLVFYEAKFFSNKELRANEGSPSVVEQMSRYEKMLQRRRQEILDVYKSQVMNLLALDGLSEERRSYLQSTNLIDLDTKPRLLIFGFDQAQKQWWDASRFREVLVNELGADRIIARGSTNGFKLPR